MSGPADSNSEEVKRLYLESGLTAAEVAARLGCSPTTVFRRLAALGVPRRPRGPQPAARAAYSAWSPALAYAIGLIATDGNLSPDGRHISVTSKDIDLLETLKRCLALPNAITNNCNGQGDLSHRVQWGSRLMYAWLVSIGIMPDKSLRLGRVEVPDECFADFLRGCIDGDGSISTYTDRYNTYKSPHYVYDRLFVTLTSASRPFVEWIHDTAQRLFAVQGAVITRNPAPPRQPITVLKYGKHASIRLLHRLYYAPEVPCLARKRARALPFLHPEASHFELGQL